MSNHDRAGEGVSLRLSPADHMALRLAAGESGMSVDDFVTSLVAAHLSRRPRWNADTYSGLTDVSAAVRQLGQLVREWPRGTSERTVSAMVDALHHRLDLLVGEQEAFWRAPRSVRVLERAGA